MKSNNIVDLKNYIIIANQLSRNKGTWFTVRVPKYVQQVIFSIIMQNNSLRLEYFNYSIKTRAYTLNSKLNKLLLEANLIQSGDITQKYFDNNCRFYAKNNQNKDNNN